MSEFGQNQSKGIPIFEIYFLPKILSMNHSPPLLEPELKGPKYKGDVGDFRAGFVARVTCQIKGNKTSGFRFRYSS